MKVFMLALTGLWGRLPKFRKTVGSCVALRALLFLLAVAISTVQATAQNKAQVEQQFRFWLKETVWPGAKAKRVSRATVDSAFQGVKLNWDITDLLPPGANTNTPRPQQQAEFGSPGKYFNRGSVDGAASVGRTMAKRYAKTLSAIEKKTGVPGRVILAVWGRESDYGRAKIPYNVFQILGTKGFMGRRAEYFTDELIAALQIAQAGHAVEFFEIRDGR